VDADFEEEERVWGSSTPPRPRRSSSGQGGSSDEVAVNYSDQPVPAPRDSDSWPLPEERGGGEEFLARDAACQKGLGLGPMPRDDAAEWGWAWA
jgi:hypothetical protein